jgi:hypothetical protein
LRAYRQLSTLDVQASYQGFFSSSNGSFPNECHDNNIIIIILTPSTDRRPPTFLEIDIEIHPHHIKETKMNHSNVLFILLGNYFLSLRFVRAEDGDDEDFANFLQTVGAIGPYLFAFFLVIFFLHLLIYPNWATIRLMKAYLEDGARISGTVLDCEERPSTTTSTSTIISDATKKSWNVDVMWECKEHQFADNPILKSRHPDAIEVRRFARCFEFEDEQIVGAFVPVLVPLGTTQPRSGCPVPVVERIFKQETHKDKTQSRIVLSIGLILILIILISTVRVINHEMEYPLAGWVVLVTSLSVIEAASLLYCNNKFLKNKSRAFDGARSMISIAEI